MISLFLVLILIPIAQSGLLIGVTYSLIRRRKRFQEYNAKMQEVAASISDFDDPARRPKMAIAFYNIGNKLSVEDAPYLKLTGACLRGYTLFLTQQREELFDDRTFLGALQEVIVDLGSFIADRDEQATAGAVLQLCKLLYKYPHFDTDLQKSRDLEMDLSSSSKLLRARNRISAFSAWQILKKWSFSDISKAENNLIFIKTITTLIFPEMGRIKRFHDACTMISKTIDKSLEYNRENKTGEMFRTQTLMFNIIAGKEPAWKSTVYERRLSPAEIFLDQVRKRIFV